MLKKLQYFILWLALGLPLLPCAEVMAQSVSLGQLMQLTRAGASLEIDLRSSSFSASELLMLASSLPGNATLTIIVGPGANLSISQCLQIVRAKPGQIVFRF